MVFYKRKEGGGIEREKERERRREAETTAPVSRQHMASFFLRLLSGLRHRSSTSITAHTEPEISQSSRSDAAMLAVDSDHSIIELGNQTPVSNTETASPSAIGIETNPAIETEGKSLQKTAKVVFGFALGLSVTIIIAVITNMRKLARNKGELILYKASAGLALLCFFAGVGLLISILVEVRGDFAQTIIRRTQLGLIAVTVVSLIASVVVLAMNAVI